MAQYLCCVLKRFTSVLQNINREIQHYAPPPSPQSPIIYIMNVIEYIYPNTISTSYIYKDMKYPCEASKILGVWKYSMIFYFWKYQILTQNIQKIYSMNNDMTTTSTLALLWLFHHISGDWWTNGWSWIGKLLQHDFESQPLPPCAYNITIVHWGYFNIDQIYAMETMLLKLCQD